MPGSEIPMCFSPSDARPAEALSTERAGYDAASGTDGRDSSLSRPPFQSLRGSHHRALGERRDRDSESKLISSCGQYGSGWDPIASIEWERDDFYFDLHVPGPEHYLADGVWSHNTGKTLAGLTWLHTIAMQYPGSNMCIARKTRDSMTATCLRTFEVQVLAVDAPEIMMGRDRSQRESYVYPNGSRVTIVGVSDVERAKSAEYDVIYVNEVTDLMQKDYQYLTTRLRKSTPGAGACPYKLLLSDCNPSFETHYLNERFHPNCKLPSKRLRLISKHEDNPMLWDAVNKKWTDDDHGGGERYIRVLDSMTGAFYKRMRLGIWCGEEGTVYEEFDPNYHVIKLRDVPPILYYVGAYDPSPSSRNASVMQIWGIDEDERGYMVAEAHMVGKGIDWWADQAIRFYHKYRPRQIVCDPSNPGMIELFNNRIGARYGNVAQRIAIRANNDQSAGIAQVKSALTRDMHLKTCGEDCTREDRHGKARMYFVDTALTEYDAEKDKDGVRRPRCTTEELQQLVWKLTKDGQQQRDEWDASIPHDGADCVRYFAMFNEKRGLGTRRARTKNPHKPGSPGYVMWQEKSGRYAPKVNNAQRIAG